MTRIPKSGGLLAAVLALGACSEDPSEEEGGMACTTIGCVDGFAVEFTPNAGWPAGDYEFALVLDGDTTTCTGALPLPACGTSALTCTPASDRIMISESGCALAADAHGFAGFQINPPNPTAVNLTISRDGSVLVEQSWNPEYQTSQPNGPGCAPTCTSARDELTVP
jgi:hypothetical protein